MAKPTKTSKPAPKGGSPAMDPKTRFKMIIKCKQGDKKACDMLKSTPKGK